MKQAHPTHATFLNSTDMNLISSQKEGAGVLEKWFHHFSNTPIY